MIITWNGNTIWDATTLAGNYTLQSHRGLLSVSRDAIEDESATIAGAIYRGEEVSPRIITLELVAVAPAGSTFEAVQRTWNQWHKARQGQKTLQLTTDTATYEIQAVALEPDWREESFGSGVVVQRYRCSFPFWKMTTEQSASGTFDGSSDVEISCTNNGDQATFVRIVDTGVVSEPKHAIGDDYVEISNDLTDTGDQLEIDCEPSAAVNYTPDGGAETSWYGYRAPASNFNAMQLEPGANTVTISCASTGTAVSGATALAWLHGGHVGTGTGGGGAVCVVNWYEYYEVPV